MTWPPDLATWLLVACYRKWLPLCVSTELHIPVSRLRWPRSGIYRPRCCLFLNVWNSDPVLVYRPGHRWIVYSWPHAKLMPFFLRQLRHSLSVLSFEQSRQESVFARFACFWSSAYLFLLSEIIWLHFPQTSSNVKWRGSWNVKKTFTCDIMNCVSHGYDLHDWLFVN